MKKNKRKKTRLQVVDAKALPYEKMWNDIWETAIVIYTKPPSPGDKVTAGAILSLMDLIKGRYNNEANKSEV